MNGGYALIDFRNMPMSFNVSVQIPEIFSKVSKAIIYNKPLVMINVRVNGKNYPPIYANALAVNELTSETQYVLSWGGNRNNMRYFDIRSGGTINVIDTPYSTDTVQKTSEAE